MNRLRFLTQAALGLVAAFASANAAAIGPDCRNPLSGVCWPYCTDNSCRRGIVADPDDIRAKWVVWRDRHVTPSPLAPVQLSVGNVGGKRVWKTDATGGIYLTTVSEGQAYGMLFSVLFDEQSLFDDLWTYYKGWPSKGKIGLMEWCIDKDNLPCGIDAGGAATDADEDAALALVFACKKVQAGAWTSGAHDYCADARTTLSNIHRYEVSPSGYLLSGNNWGAPTLNPSYYSPGHYRVFDAFEGGSRWETVACRAYQNIDAVQADHGQCSKLVYNWTDSTGAPVMPFEGNTDFDQFGWDAARVVWRVALDKIWFNTPPSNETMNEMGGFFKQVGARNIKPVYRMDGTTEWPWGLNAFFSANAGVGIWAADSAINPGATCGAASNQANSTAQEAYDVSKATAEPIGEYDYYNNAWQLLGLLTMSGNTPNIQALSDAPGDGFLAEYFADDRFQHLIGLGIDSSIYDLRDRRPVRCHPRNWRRKEGSVRYSGFVKPDRTDVYEFETTGDRDARIWVDGKLVSSEHRGKSGRSLRLTQGKVVPVVVEASGRDAVHTELAWSGWRQRPRIVPLSRRYPWASPQPGSVFASGKTYTLTAGDSTGLCLTSSGPLTLLDVCDRRVGQNIAAVVDAEGWASLHVDDSCLTSTREGVAAQVCDGRDNQSWMAFEAGAGHVRLVSRQDGKVLAAIPAISREAEVAARRFDPAAPGMRWIVKPLSSCGDGICQPGEGCTSCAQDCNCGACGGFCPDGILPVFLNAPVGGQGVRNGEECFALKGVTGGVWNTPGSATTDKKIFVNGVQATWGPSGGVSLSGDACVHTTPGTFTGWAGIGTW
jgi:endo-1,4-beta-D-glucanase Y